MAHFKCIDCSASFDDEINGIVYCPYCGEIQPLPPNLTEEQKENVYIQAIDVTERAKSPEALSDVAAIFEQLDGYADSRYYAEKCRKRITELRNDEIYTKALGCMEKESVRSYKEAIALLEQIPEWRNSSFKIDEARAKLVTLIEKRQKRNEKITKIAMIISACIIAVAIIAYLIVEFAVPAIRYSSALNKLEDKEYDKAYAILEDLGNYKNAQEELKKSKYNRAVEYEMQGDVLNACKFYGQAIGYLDAEARQLELCRGLTLEQQLSVLGVGNTVIFGIYEQNPLLEGKEKMEWIITEKIDDSAMLVSKYAIEAYGFSADPSAWSKSALRTWLNSTFYDQSFTRAEKRLLLRKSVTTIYTDAEGAEKVDICEDFAFVLSENEATRYFKTADERFAPATEYLKTRNVYVNPDNGMAHYWLRSLAPNGEIMYVNGSGTINQSGKDSNTVMAVRPAIWVSTK